jgi:hypothetical protein
MRNQALSSYWVALMPKINTPAATPAMTVAYLSAAL